MAKPKFTTHHALEDNVKMRDMHELNGIYENQWILIKESRGGHQ